MGLIAKTISTVVVCVRPTLSLAAQPSQPEKACDKLKPASAPPTAGSLRHTGEAETSPTHWDALDPAALKRAAAERQKQLEMPPFIAELQCR